MCHFFSFVSYDGHFYYINAEDRKKKLLKNPDSHTQICSFFNLPEDRCNKYEYYKYDGIMTDAFEYKGDDPEGFIEKLMPKFEELCIVTIMNYGKGNEFLKGFQLTPEICLAIVEKYGYAIKYFTDEQRSPEVCLKAVMQNKNSYYHLTQDQKKAVDLVLESKN